MGQKRSLGGTPRPGGGGAEGGGAGGAARVGGTAGGGSGREEQPLLQDVLHALAAPSRREILWLVWHRERSATEIAHAVGISPATASSHLGVLRRAGLVTQRRQGTYRFYRAEPDAVEGLRGVLGIDAHKWFPGTTPAPLAPARTVGVVVVQAQAPCDQATAFRTWVDGELYGRWLGVPVSIVDGRFAADMEWGLKVRGTYDHVVEPSLIVMTWDFAADHVPLPGDGQRAYLEIAPAGSSCALTIHQLVRSDEEARYMERAWGLVLGRFRDHVLDALDRERPTTRRPRRARSLPGEAQRPR